MSQVIACQHDIVWEDKAASDERVRACLASVRVQPGALIVLPEMFATGYSMDAARIAEGDDRPSERFMIELARAHEATVVGGVVTLDDDGRGRNQAVAFGPDGRELARYTKMHPMTLGGEAEHYRPGEHTVVFRWGDWGVAPLICYDLRFPERFREAVRQGAQLFVVIANFPAARHAHWRALLLARAIENQACVVGVNRCGDDPKQHYAGGSMILDPRGQILAEAGDEPTALTATLDLPALLEYREAFPALRDMRD